MAGAAPGGVSARRSLSADLARAYLAPRAAARRVAGAGMPEARALVLLLLGCFLLFVASLPQARRAAGGIAAEGAFAGAAAAHFFGYLMLAPLMFYGLAALFHPIARRFGGRGSFRAMRAAVFRSVLLAGPLALIAAGVETLTGPGVAARVAGVLAFGYWLWLLAAGVAAAEGFARTAPVAALLAGGFGALGLVLALAAGA